MQGSVGSEDRRPLVARAAAAAAGLPRGDPVDPRRRRRMVRTSRLRRRSVLERPLAFARDVRAVMAGDRDRALDQPLDVAQERAFLVVAERDGDPARAGAAGAADAMDVGL